MSLFDAAEYEVPAEVVVDPVEVVLDPVEVVESVESVVDVESVESDGDDPDRYEPGDDEPTSGDDPVRNVPRSGGPDAPKRATARRRGVNSSPVDGPASVPRPRSPASRAAEAPLADPDPEALWAPVVGQPRAVSQLRGSLPNPVHAYLFVGPAGAGKRVAANSFAAALLCPRGGCATCGVCARVLASIHPDVTTVDREGASISVDQARDIIRLASRAPIEGARQVLVLVDFHLVQNAGPTLLKIIEEPPPSTIFVILADHLPPELITIASRCVQVAFDALSPAVITETLVAEGIDPERAAKAAAAAGGRMDRARLLAVDDYVEQRRSFWAELPRRLDGTGAAVATLAAEAMVLVDSAAVGPLEARQAAELKALEERVEAMGGRGNVGMRKDLVERHKRELKRLRDDELRSGLSALQSGFRTALLNSPTREATKALRAIEAIAEANEALIRNPNVALLLQALFIKIGSP